MLRKVALLLILTVAFVTVFNLGYAVAGDKKCKNTKVTECKSGDHSKCCAQAKAACKCEGECKCGAKAKAAECKGDHSKCCAQAKAACKCEGECKCGKKANASKCKQAAACKAAPTCKTAKTSKFAETAAVCKTVKFSKCEQTAAKCKTVKASSCAKTCASTCKTSLVRGKKCADQCWTKPGGAAHAAAVKKVTDKIPYCAPKRLVLTGNLLCGKCQVEGLETCQPMVKTSDGKIYPLVRNVMIKKMKRAGADNGYKISGRVKNIYGVKYLDVTSYTEL